MFNQEIGNWDTSSVIHMSHMFSLTPYFNQPLNDWNVSSVTGMLDMFDSAESFNQDISEWNVSAVKNMSNMFAQTDSLSNSNKVKIHASFSSNANWPYDWSDLVSEDLNATVSGKVFYNGVIPGPTYVWAIDANRSKVAEFILPEKEGNYSLILPKGQAYDIKAFVDGTGNGYPDAAESWKHYGDWNSTSKRFNLTRVEGNLTGIDFRLYDNDYDQDGFLNWYEYQAGTDINDANSYPPIHFGLQGIWTLKEMNGSRAIDFSENSNHAELRIDQNTSSSYLEIPHIENYESDRGTVSMWVNFESLEGKQGLFSKDAKGLVDGGHLSIYLLDGNLSARLQSAKRTHSMTYSAGIETGTWYRIAFSWGENGMKLHLNGHLVASDSYDGGLGKSSGGLGNREEILLGAGSWRKDPITDESIEGFLQGKLRSVRFYNRVLTSAEIIRLSTIERSNANDPPFNLNSTAPLQVLENQPIGTQVGLLTADDPDENNTLTFTLVSGALDNHLFTLESNGSLETAAAFDFERISSYAIRAKVRDQYNAWIKKDFIITVLDMDEKDSQNSEDDRNQTNDSKIDENQNDDLDDGLPPVTDGNQTVVDHNDTKPDPTVVEPVTPKYVPIVRTQEVVINDKEPMYFEVEF